MNAIEKSIKDQLLKNILADIDTIVGMCLQFTVALAANLIRTHLSQILESAEYFFFYIIVIILMVSILTRRITSK